MDTAPNSGPASALLAVADTASAVRSSAPPPSASRKIAPGASTAALACGGMVGSGQVAPPNPARSCAAGSWSAVML